MNKISAISGVFLLAAVILGGCSGDPVAPHSQVDYRVEGVLVKSLDGGSARIDLTLTRDSIAYKKAVITLGTTVLDTNAFGYSKTFAPADIAIGQNYNLNIHDSTWLNVNLIISVPGSLAITAMGLPASRLYSGLSFAVDWSDAANANGYILATDPPSAFPDDTGYAEYVSISEGTLTPAALKYNDELVAGTHKVYVAAFIGAPTATPGLPIEIPTANNPDDNVSKTILFGRLAGMVLSVPDSVVVP
ncbi:MAG: hypothetical protein GYA46_12750 [candidate division Zixibacteria bacterium]|nr:hypothetical protein [candidate division Zixibacteria bacterium]